MRLLLLAVFFGAGIISCANASSTWQSLSFDGSGFVAGEGSGTLRVREGYLPVLAESAPLREDQLAEGMGALALYCYRQQSGGKLNPQPGHAPMPGVAVAVNGASVAFAARTDANGYLILALPAGEYQLDLLGFSRKVTVQNGKTALVALRGGKRMGD